MIVCYLLRSRKISSRSYIGYTTDICRRIKQHNGKLKGGGKYTKMYRPWNVELLISGFKTKNEAMKFEWAWKHPYKVYYLKSIKNKNKRSKKELAQDLIINNFTTCTINKISFSED